MNDPKVEARYESILLRVLWMILFVLVWQVAQFILGAVVLVQLIYRLFYGAPSASLMNFGDSLSQFLAQIGRFGSFHSCLLYTSPSPRDGLLSRMPSSA